MHVVITGGGFLARYLTRQLCARGDSVVVFTRSETNAVTLSDFVGSPNCTVRIKDIHDLTPADLGDCNPVVHTAAMKHIDLCGQFPLEAMRANIEGTIKVLAVAKSAHCPVIHVSTDKAVEAATLYGATKLIAERLAIHHGATVARLPNLFGSTGSVIPRWVESLRTTGAMNLTNPEMLRYFCHPEDAARLIVGLLDNPKPGKVCIPDSHEVRLGDLATLVGERSGKRFDIRVNGLRPHEKMREVMFLPSETNVIAGRQGLALQTLIGEWVREFVPMMGTENINPNPVFPEG